jgi:outer membrane protein, heavy metal efflux system
MSLRVSLPAALMLALLAGVPAGAQGQSALDSLLRAPSLELPLLERAVLTRNPSLGAMRSAWREADAAADRAGSLEDPMLEVMTAPASWSSNAVDPAYSASLSQHLPLFGQRGLKARAARAGARAVGEDYRSAKLDILREARQAYYEYFLTGRGRAVNADVKELLTQLRRSAVGRYSAGTVGLDDALQADVEIAMLDHEDVALTRTRRVAVSRLNALLQREPGSPLPEPPDDLALPAEPTRSDSLVALARAARPELRGWSAQRESREAGLSLARRQRLPELTFSARYDRFMEEREWRPQVGLAMNLPLQFGRLGATEREARAGVEQMEYRRKAAEAQIGAEVESALAGIQETGHEIRIMEDRVLPATERALRAIRASYENSRAGFPALLNAGRDLARARFELYRAKTAYLQSFADLERALGMEPGEETSP